MLNDIAIISSKPVRVIVVMGFGNYRLFKLKHRFTLHVDITPFPIIQNSGKAF